MTDTTDFPPLPRPYVPCDEQNPHDFYTTEQMHAYLLSDRASRAPAQEAWREAAERVINVLAFATDPREELDIKDIHILAALADHAPQAPAPQAAVPVADDVRTALEIAFDALSRARVFISNGVELGFIRMPDKDTPDPAHEVPAAIDAALEAARRALSAQQEGGKT